MKLNQSLFYEDEMAKINIIIDNTHNGREIHSVSCTLSQEIVILKNGTKKAKTL